MFDLAIGFRHSCVKIDVLHTVDLGVAAHIIANVFVLLVVTRGCWAVGRMMSECVGCMITYTIGTRARRSKRGCRAESR